MPCNPSYHIHRKGYSIRLVVKKINGDEEFSLMGNRFYEGKPPSGFDLADAIHDMFFDKDISDEEYYVAEIKILESEFVIKNN